MQNSKLGLDFTKVAHAKDVARKIADDVQKFVEQYSTVAVERTLCRLLGIDGIDANTVPLPNVLVDEIKDKGVLGEGILFFLGNAIVETGMNPQQIAEKVAEGTLDITTLPIHPTDKIKAALKPHVDASIKRISDRRAKKENYLNTIGEGPKPYLYVIVATGNIYEDVVQAQAAARQGADVIAVIRTTGQSLLDYVPYGATTEGFGGTFATQENFRIMRKALDEVGEEVGRYIRLCNYCSGLCMPEIAAMGALEGPAYLQMPPAMMPMGPAPVMSTSSPMSGNISAVCVALPKASKKETTSSGRLSSMAMTLRAGMQTNSANAPSRSTPTPMWCLHH